MSIRAMIKTTNFPITIEELCQVFRFGDREGFSEAELFKPSVQNPGKLKSLERLIRTEGRMNCFEQNKVSLFKAWKVSWESGPCLKPPGKTGSSPLLIAGKWRKDETKLPAGQYKLLPYCTKQAWHLPIGPLFSYFYLFVYFRCKNFKSDQHKP